jgi:hypothetical protein
MTPAYLAPSSPEKVTEPPSPRSGGPKKTNKHARLDRPIAGWANLR